MTGVCFKVDDTDRTVRGHIGESTGRPTAHEQGSTGEQTVERRSSRRDHLRAAGRTVNAGEKERGGGRLGEGTSAGGHSGANETSGYAAARHQEKAPDRGRKRLRDETRVMPAAAPMDTREGSELSLTAIGRRNKGEIRFICVPKLHFNTTNLEPRLEQC